MIRAPAEGTGLSAATPAQACTQGLTGVSAAIPGAVVTQRNRALQS